MSAQIVEPKPGRKMGRVTVAVRVENWEDRLRATRGEIPAEAVRKLNIEALVDTGATYFCLPAPIINQLGLVYRRERETKTIHGPFMMKIHGIASIEVEGRSCDVEVMELPEGRQCLLGQIPLETLDFWVDLAQRKLVGNPEHGGQWMAEVY